MTRGTEKRLESGLDHALIDPLHDVMHADPSFDAALNVHGKYETMRFVLRLSPRNHELLKGIETGVHNLSEISSETLQAYSTYIHETVHWWQHVGSTSGLMLSLSYLAQSHSSLTHLRDTLKAFGPIKPLKRWADETLIAKGHSAQKMLADPNVAINNALDVEYFKLYAMWPQQQARILFAQQHFECVGHCYHIAVGQLLGMVSSAIDPDFEFIPDGKVWEDEFRRLTRIRHEGFYHGSPLRVPPVGLHAIYEGQARFIQLQFLDGTQKSPITTEAWRDQGYLSGIYVEAFEAFLELSGTDWPSDIRGPVVGIFLLICDIAINPTRGFPLNVEIFEDFIPDIDVGVRFTLLCQALRELPHLKTAITDFSRDEYIAVSDELTARAGYDHPLAALVEIAKWSKHLTVQQLMNEHKTFEFRKVNLPIRVFLSHFLSFSADRLQHPEFFCWPGIWKTSAATRPDRTDVWLRHLSLFSDRGEKPGVYPRRWPNRSGKAIKEMFDSFYGSMALYDLTRQWILQEGPFVCDYRWLFESYSQERADAWAEDTFKQVYGVFLSDFVILPKP
ncbi:MAG: hypothetical protein KGQ75_06055 [Sphingomonadales bacterium]|nr:hypothetical protein [Sphingomonadales bacterium]